MKNIPNKNKEKISNSLKPLTKIETADSFDNHQPHFCGPDNLKYRNYCNNFHGNTLNFQLA